MQITHEEMTRLLIDLVLGRMPRSSTPYAMAFVNHLRRDLKKLSPGAIVWISAA